MGPGGMRSLGRPCRPCHASFRAVLCGECRVWAGVLPTLRKAWQGQEQGSASWGPRGTVRQFPLWTCVPFAWFRVPFPLP